MSLVLLVILLAPAAAPAQDAPETPPSPAASAIEREPSALPDLYRSILPPPSDPEAVDREAADAAGTAPAREDRHGVTIGRLTLTPRLDAFYFTGEGTLETARPVEDSYLEIRPSVAADAPLGSGALRGSYRAHIRRGSAFELVDSTTTHLADLALAVEAGSLVELEAAGHIARGILETSEVDPGREYFFQLGRYRRRLLGASARLIPGGRIGAAAGASHDVIEVEDPAAFFDYVRDVIGADLTYELGAEQRARLGYSYTRIPFTSDRPEAEANIHSVGAGIHGEILPLTTGHLHVSYTRHESPNAAVGGRLFTGVTASGRLEKSFSPSTVLTLAGGRSTNVSGFEGNAFYVSNSFEARLRAGLPASFAVETGAGWHRNTYETVSALIDAPRRDSIRGWTVGLARPLTSRAYARADYRRERRDSNIDGFDTSVSALTVEVGVGFFAAADGR